jgi:hypothetical protein
MYNGPQYKKATQAEDAKRKLNIPMDNLIKNYFSIDAFYKNIHFFLFMTGLSIIYIFLGQYGESKSRQLKTLKREVEELEWSISIERSKLLNKSNYTEVAKLSNNIGLEESINKPDLIVAKD